MSDAAHLDTLLVSLQMQRLRPMAAARGVETRGASRDDLVQRLTAALLDRAALVRAVADLPGAARRVLEYALLWDGEPPLPALRAAAARLAGGAAEGDRLVDDLLAGGLLLVQGGHRAPPGARAYVPLAARAATDKGLVAAVPAPSAPAGTVPAPPTPDLLPLLLHCWREAHDGALALPVARQAHPAEYYYLGLQGWYNLPQEIESFTGRGVGRWRTPDRGAVLSVAQPPVGLAQVDRRRLMGALHVGERQLAFAYRLLRALTLVIIAPTGFVASAEGMIAFLGRPAEERLRMLAEAWIDDRTWSELFQVRDIGVARAIDDGGSKQDALLGSLATGRRLIARLLGRLSPDGWYAVGDLMDALRHLQPDLPAPFTTVPGAPRPWFLRGPGSRVLDLENPRDWRAAAGGFVARLLLGPLSWLGAVELALDPAHDALPDHQAIVALRLTARGAALLEVPAGEPEPAGDAPPCPCVRLDDDLSATPTDAAPAAVHARLRDLAVAQLTSDVTLRYRLVPERLEAVGDVQAATRSLVDLLEGHGIPPLPEAAWTAVRRWGERVGQVALYRRVSVVEAADPAALEEVLAVLGGSAAVIARLSDRSLLVDAEAVPALRGDLVARGYTPRPRRPGP